MERRVRGGAWTGGRSRVRFQLRFTHAGPQPAVQTLFCEVLLTSFPKTGDSADFFFRLFLGLVQFRPGLPGWVGGGWHVPRPARRRRDAFPRVFGVRNEARTPSAPPPSSHTPELRALLTPSAHPLFFPFFPPTFPKESSSEHSNCGAQRGGHWQVRAE